MNPDPMESSGRAAILAAAESLFAEHGFDGVSVNAVAQKAGVSKANVFHHFGSKDDLYVAVLNRVRSGFINHLLHLGGSADDTRRRLGQMAEAHLDNLLDNDALARLLLRESLEKSPGRSRELAQPLFEETFSHMVALVRAAQAKGDLRPGLNPAAAVMLLVAANMFFFQASDIVREFEGMEFAADADAFRTQVLEVLWTGLAGQQREITEDFSDAS